MMRSQKILIYSGLALLVFAMTYGLWYAVFVEHQRLEQVGNSLAASFSAAAAGDMTTSVAQLSAYEDAKYLYVREVDAHSHWAGLAILLVMFGAAFQRVSFTERVRASVAVAFAGCSFVFPLSVLLENFDRGVLPRVLAAVTAAILIASLTMMAAAFARPASSDRRKSG